MAILLHSDEVFILFVPKPLEFGTLYMYLEYGPFS